MTEQTIEERITSLELYRASHEGKITAWWESQFSWNSKKEREDHTRDTRLTAVEKRVVWLAGLAAGVGAYVGNYFQGGG